MAKRWATGHISRFWDQESFKNFPYVRQPLLDSEVKEWRDNGYDYVKSFSGSMYDNRNPMPEWVKRFDKIFDFKNMTFNFYKMSQLEIMPEHSDHYQTYMRLTGAQFNNIRRILIMLEDWKPGHYLEVDGTGITNWLAGDYFIWENDVKHAASNIGTEDRYTLQITGEVYNNNDIYKNVHWYNIPNLPSKKESISTPEMLHMKVRMGKETPYMIYMYNQTITELENLKHSEETIEGLNQSGLEIYLFEPLCSYRKDDQQMYPPYGTKHSLLFYSEFHYDQVQNADDMRAVELDSIEKYIENNGLTNVTVHTCDYNIEKFYTHYLSKMKLDCDDLFVKHYDINEFEPLYEVDMCDEFTRRFISMNWRYAPHRQLVSAYLANILIDKPKSAMLTWYFRADMGNVSVEPWYSLHDWSRDKPELFNKMIKGIHRLNQDAPWNIDVGVKQPTLITDKYFKEMYPATTIYDHKMEKYGDNRDKLKVVYAKIFCDVVTESRFAQPTANYSEKVYRPMFYKKPFIMVGPPHTLGYMHSQGFETFGDFWDEGYDAMEDHESRLLAVFKIIDMIDNMSIEELRELYEKMKPIVEHNRKVLLEKCPNRS